MSSGSSSAKARRTAARLAAVQALYQLELGDNPTGKQAVYDLMQMRQDDIPEKLVEPDSALLQAIVDGVGERLADIDSLLQGAIGEGRGLERTEAVLRAILRAGVFELLADSATASGIIINDYVNVAHAYFDAAEPGKVNAVLDKVAKNIGR
jgi:N utilization substance protein B